MKPDEKAAVLYMMKEITEALKAIAVSVNTIALVAERDVDAVQEQWTPSATEYGSDE